MGFDNTITIVGNVTRDPELRFTQGGMAIASFSVAWNRKKQDAEDEVSFFDVTCFRKLAENVAESISRGTRVVVYGTLKQDRWENNEGQNRSKIEILADDVAPSLKWASAQISRNDFQGGGAPQGGGYQQSPPQRDGGGQQPPQNRPAPAPAYNLDEEPF